MTQAQRPVRRRRLSAIALVWVLALLALISCGSATPAPGFGHGTLRITTAGGPVTLSVRTASTPAAKAQGLMNRTELPENAGMAFLSGEPSDTPFWMKDTTIPLSVAFWNTHHRIVDMLDISPCSSDPCPLYRSS